MSLALKSTARAVRLWRNRIMFALSGLITISILLLILLSANQSQHMMQHEINYQVASIKPYLKQWPDQALNTEQSQFIQQRFHSFNHVDVLHFAHQKQLPLVEAKLFDWIRTTERVKITDNTSLRLTYTLLPTRAVYYLFSLAVALISLSCLVLAVVAKMVEAKFFSLEKKARKLAIAKRRSEHIKNRSLLGLLDSLLDELAWSRNEQTRIDKFIRKQTFLDAELGIGNRIFFDHRIEAALNANEHGQSGAVMLVHFHELDRVEKLHGAETARHILLEYCHLINQSHNLPTEPLLARRAYMELAVLFVDIDDKDLIAEAELLLQRLKLVELPDNIDPDNFYHIGLAPFKSGYTAYQVLSEADMALRNAQLQGPSGWFMYEDNEKPKTAVMGALKWRTLLEKSVSTANFVLLFQPVLGTNSQAHHQQVFVKLPDDDGNLLNASVFLPMAKKCGFQARIESIVIKKLFDLFNQDASSRASSCISLSCESLVNKDFFNWLDGFLIEQDEQRDRMIIALNEYALNQYSNELIRPLKRLSELGIRILVEQVGQYVVHSGYLRQHPIAYLKLHVSIIRNIQSRPENELFIRSLKGAVAGSPVRLFASGVSEHDEWQALLKLQIDGGQGQLFDEKIENLLARSE
ncbi:EAL domain-containing protein [Catenovulum sp. SM1970]|uniref:EAL domain-containing protein n=1 Tax=Marinifaba aquimaris TaxID=2741323 RepID=UPI001571A114|nr:EAL domain-containing protein [Marinifaba aquimaris]NTS75853.1 EAL domain-containing protein [Marinifaba aquimaris]